MTPADAALWGGATALGVSVGAARLVAWAGPVDAADVARASHTRPTPTSGGLAAIAGVAIGLLVWAALARPTGAAPVWIMLGLAALSGLVGALDDLFDFGARPKLLIGLILAILAPLAAPVAALPWSQTASLPLPLLVGLAGGALWMVTVVNAVNFMDGANGVAAGGLAIAFSALALAALAGGAPAVGAAALTGAGASAGLLPLNMGGRLFQGDAGALFAGFLFAGLCLQAQGAVFLYFGPLALLPFLTDVLLTLLRRARGRRPLLSAHREHLYQRWLQAHGGDHDALARRVWVVMAAYGVVGVGLSFAPAGVQTAGFATAVVVSATAWTALSRRLP